MPLNKTQDRRRFLRGMAGGAATVMALPVMESLFETERAFAQDAETPRVWFTYQPNGYAREAFYPTAVRSNRDYDLTGCSLEPLELHKDKFTIFKHLRNSSADTGSNAHLVSLASYLTGRTIPNDDGEGHVQSVDFFISKYLQEQSPTLQRQLILCANDEVDPKSQDYNNRFKNNLSFDDEGRFVTSTNHLKNVFDSLFAGFAAPDPGTGVDRRAVIRGSVIDSVLEDAKGFETRLGTRDLRVMDQYFSAIRDLERRLSSNPIPGSVACEPGDNGYAEYPAGPQERVDRVGEHWIETAQLLALAFQCEATRVASYLLGGEAAGSRYTDAGINKHIHNTLSHSGGGANREDYKKLDRFHAEIFAQVLDIFEGTPVGTGTLLDHTILHLGTGLGDGNPHEKNNLMALVAGNVGTMRHGAIINVDNNDNTPKLMNTIVQQMGVDAPDGFGDSNGAGDVFELS